MRRADSPKLPAGLWILFSTEFLLTAGLALSFPFLALYLNRTRGLPVGLVGAFVSATLFMAALSQGFGGELSDRLGRRRVMVTAMCLRAVLVLALSEAVRRGSPVGLIAALQMVGTFAGNLYGPAARSWIADHCPARSRVRAYGLLRVGTNAGWAVGPAVGGFMAGTAYAAMFRVSALACGVCALIIMGLIRDKDGVARSGSFSAQGVFRAAGDRRFAAFCACAFLIGLVMSQMVAPLSVHAVQNVGLSEAQVGWLFSINGCIVVACQYLVSRVLSRRPITSALSAGSVIYAVGYGAVGFASSFAALAACMSVVSFGEIAVSPGLHALGANMAPDELKGRYVGFSSLAYQLGFAGGPLLGGICQQSLGLYWPAGPWLLIASVGLLAAAGFHALRTRLAREEEGLDVREPLAAPAFPEVA